MTTASTLSRQLCLDVHPADGALLIGDEPLVHAQLVEEVHTRETPGEETGHTLARSPAFNWPPCTAQDSDTRRRDCVRFSCTIPIKKKTKEAAIPCN